MRKYKNLGCFCSIEENVYLCTILNKKSMSTKNIFAGRGIKTTFVNILYEQLMKREYVTLAEIMCIKRRYPKDFYENNPKATLSREIFYGDLKKASS